MVKNPPTSVPGQETRVPSLGLEDPLEEEMATHSSILPGKSHGQRSLVGYSLKGCKESDTTEQLSTSLRKKEEDEEKEEEDNDEKRTFWKLNVRWMSDNQFSRS